MEVTCLLQSCPTCFCGHISKEPSGVGGGGLPGVRVLLQQRGSVPLRFLNQPDWTVSSFDPAPKQGWDFLSPSKPHLEDMSDPLTVNETWWLGHKPHRNLKSLLQSGGHASTFNSIHRTR